MLQSALAERKGWISTPFTAEVSRPLILLVDDTEVTRYTLRKHLERAGYLVREAGSEKEALQELETKPPDLVVLDVNLPDGNGLNLCRRLRSNPSTARLPIVQVSASLTRGEDYARGLDAGADSYLVQPVDSMVLLATVRSLLRARAAEAAQARLAAIVENADEPIISTDFDGVITSWNPAAERLFGFSAVEAIGQPLSIIIPPECQDQEQWIVARLAQGESVEQLETVRATRDGRLIDVVVTASPIRDEVGRIVGASKIVRDITRRKEAEEALRASEASLKAVIENLQEGLVVVNAAGTVLRWNRMALEMHGYTKQDESLGVWSKLVDLYEVLTPEGRPVPVERWPIPRLLREGTLRNYELLIRHRQKPCWERIFSYGGVMLAGKPSAEPMGLLTTRDVTDQRRAADELRRREERYRCFVEASSQLVWTMNPVGEVSADIADWNEYTGQTAQESRGSGWLNAIFPEDRGAVIAAWRKAVSSREPYRVEYRLRRRDGAWRNIMARGVPVLEADGSIREWVGTCTDITEQRQAQAALLESRNRLVMAQRAGRLGVFDWNLTTGQTYWTEELEQLLGLSPGSFEGTYEAWTQRVHPEDLRRLNQLFEKATAEHQTNLDFDYRIRRTDGELRWFAARAEIHYDSHGKAVRMLGTNADITDRKRAEEDLQRQVALVDLTPTAMLVRALDGTIRLWNKGAESLYGWSKQEALRRRSEELLKTEFPEPFEKILDTLRETGRWSGELRHRARDGRELVVQSWWLAERTPAGEIVEILESSVDVTERKRFQQELERTVAERTAKLRETVADLEHFSYTITHDMRAPLRAMQIFGHLLELEHHGQLDETGRDYLKRIVESSKRMDHLITDALSYTKVVRQEMDLGAVDVEALLQSMVNSYPEFQPPKADVRIEPGIPWVLGNNAGLTQCFSNLLGNAVKFVHPGTLPRVRVWGERRGHRVRLWVEDNGIGISSEGQRKIFTMFQRLSKEHEGTGIGLALVQKVVERMRGKVGVESEPGKGSRFWVELKPAPKAS